MTRLMKGISVCLFALIVAFFVAPSNVVANDFDESLVRLHRMKISEDSTPILVVIEPSTLTAARSETTFRFVFPTGFSVDATAGNITTSTSNLPDEFQGNTLTAMPGLSATANSVSGQQVDFSISNLTDGNYYAFYITDGITNPSTARSYKYTISTRDGGGEIDTNPAGADVDVVSNDRVTVSASIPARSAEAELSIDGTPRSGSTLHNDDTIDAVITYRSDASSSKPFTIVASWEKGTVSGSSSEVEVFDYVVGSATNAYASTTPNVDLQNRKITWSISSMPPTTESFTVRFKLRVRSDVPRGSSLIARVHVDGTIQSATIPRDSISYTIEHHADLTATPVPQVTSTPDSGFDFEHVRLLNVTNVDARISIRATEDARVNLVYGLKPGQLDQRIQSLTYERTTLVDVANLTPDTRYYFRVTIMSKDGKTRTSDIFTFKTALSKSTIDIDQREIFWKQLLLSNGENQSIIIPYGKPMSIKVHVRNPDDVKSIVVQVAKKGVLGINTFSLPVNEIETHLIQSLPGEFIGELQAPRELGNYQLLVKTEDVYGGFFTDVLHPNIMVTEPITFINKKTGQPIESASAMIQSYIPVNRTFVQLDKAISYVPVANVLGQLDIVLPVGRYKVIASALGYKSQDVEFDLNQARMYPIIELEPSMNIPVYAMYHFTGLKQLGLFLNQHLQNVGESPYARAGLRMICAALTLILFILYIYVRHKVEKSHKKNERAALHELFNVIMYTLFSTGIVATVGAFLLVLIYGGFKASIPFFVLACFDIMLLDLIVLHVTHLQKK